MSKKRSPSCGSLDNRSDGQMDFLLKTINERKKTGKRQIRQSNVIYVEESAVSDDSNDPDFEVDKGSKLRNWDYSDEDSSSQSAPSESGDTDSSGNSEESSSEDNNARKNVNGRKFKLLKRKVKVQNVPTTKVVKYEKVNLKSSVANGIAKAKKSPTAFSKKRAASALLSHAKANMQKIAQSKIGDKKDKSETKGKGKFGSDSKRHMEKEKKNTNFNSSIFGRVEKILTKNEEIRKQMGEVRFEICSVCLGEERDETNEIIICYSCGITVHEECYDGENVINASKSESSFTRESWCCDPCSHKNEVAYQEISCELCPNPGGLFRKGKTGRWHHVVCARYTSGLVEIDSDLPFSSGGWQYRPGMQNCSLCEDEKDATKGVTIECEFCKTRLHATCGQRAGILPLVKEIGPTTSCPKQAEYYLVCKLHSDKELARRQSQSFKVLQGQLRHSKGNKSQKFHDRRVSKEDDSSEDLEQSDTQMATNDSRKRNVKPGITTAFLSYYKMREAKISTMVDRCTTLETSNSTLTVQMNALKGIIDESSANNEAIAEDSKEIELTTANLKSIVNGFKQTTANHEDLIPPCYVFIKRCDQVHPVNRPSTSTASSPSAKNMDIKSEIQPKHSRSGDLLEKCNSCPLSGGQKDTILQCSEYKRQYHLQCLKKPLTRLEEKKREEGWMCSECKIMHKFT